MTIIELLVASALAAMLLVTVSAVIGSLSARTRAILQDGAAQPWRQQLVAQLYWDLANAREMDWQPDRLTLTGYGSRDFDSSRPTQRPCRVEYLVRQIGTHSWLLRRETPVDTQSRSDSRLDLVCVDVSSLEIQSENVGEDLPDRAVPDRAVPDRAVPIPRQLRLLLRREEAVFPVVDQVFFFNKPDEPGPGLSNQANQVRDNIPVDTP